MEGGEDSNSNLGMLLEMEPISESYERLAFFTNNFSEKNYIGRFQYGKLYRGMRRGIKRTIHLIVKIWEVPEIYDYNCGDNKLRQTEEIILLHHEVFNNHPGMVKLYASCRDGEYLGAVYELESKPLDSVFNLIPKNGFTWLQRMKAALGLASVLRFLHYRYSRCYTPFVVNNLDAAHIVLDEEYNPKLCDFGWISGGIFPERRTCTGCYGYTDINSSSTGHCSNKQDVFAFGVILLSLISKKVYTEEDRVAGAPFVYEWARREYEAFESDSNLQDTELSLVNESLAAEDGFCGADGHKITKLALQCINQVESQRPSMKQVHRVLSKLEVVKQHAEFFRENKQPRPSKDGY